MSKVFLVFRVQLSLFKRDKGMIFFYCLAIAIFGIIPVFTRNVESSLTMAAFLTVMFLKPMLSDSLAGERENRTLETFLSSPMSGKSIVWGKFLFCFLFAACFYGLTAMCTALTNWIVCRTTMMAWQWIGIIFLAVLSFGAISIAGIHASATSEDMRVANSRVSLATYPLGLLFLVCSSVIFTADMFSAVIVGIIFMTVYLCVILFFTVKSIRMKQADYFENIIEKGEKVHKNRSLHSTPKSQFGIVFGFEMKYLLKLKLLLLNFAILCFAPALIACLMTFYPELPFYTGKFELNYAVLVTALMIPRIPTNLIAFSIGGEKAYKTGESLLSTPLNIRSIFLAKCMIPVFITLVMLILSSLFTLTGAVIVGRIMPDAVSSYGYTAEQLILMFPVSIMASSLMMFLSAILALIMKTPRQSLYATSIISFLFLLPVLAIVTLARNTLMWSLIYLAVLFICNAICVGSISDKVTRPQLMSRL